MRDLDVSVISEEIKKQEIRNKKQRYHKDAAALRKNGAGYRLNQQAKSISCRKVS